MQVESQYTPLIFLSSSVFVKTKRVSWYLFLIFALAVPDLCHLIPLAKYSPSVALLFRHSFIHVDSFFPHSRGVLEFPSKRCGRTHFSPNLLFDSSHEGFSMITGNESDAPTEPYDSSGSDDYWGYKQHTYRRPGRFAYFLGSVTVDIRCSRALIEIEKIKLKYIFAFHRLFTPRWIEIRNSKFEIQI